MPDIEAYLVAAAEYLILELNQGCLIVRKQPSEAGGYLRVVLSTNCQWYRQFCAEYTRFRKSRDRTIIKRCHTITALNRIIRGDRTTVYATRLLPFVYDIAEEMSRPVVVEASRSAEEEF